MVVAEIRRNGLCVLPLPLLKPPFIRNGYVYEPLDVMQLLKSRQRVLGRS